MDHSGRLTAVEHLHLKTPLLWSPPLSEKTGHEVWLKLENAQNAGSYKIRGLGRFCENAVKNGCKHFISSSGGNAGLAAAYAAKKLGVDCTVVVPETTAPFMIEKIKKVAKAVEIVGKAWDDANNRAIEIAKGEGCVLIHPFDHPDIWAGHSTIVDEIVRQLHGKKPHLFVLSVGGGGLLSGVLQGLHRHHLADVPVLTMETEGAKSFKICVDSGQHLALDKIDTIAVTLGAKKVCKRAFDWIAEHKHIVAQTCTDKQACEAAINFANDHRFLVSPSCGAALSPLYTGIVQNLQKEGKLPQGRLNIITIVCGGSEVTLKAMDDWKVRFGI